MSEQLKTNRRNFLKITATVGGGLLLGFNISDTEAGGIGLIDKSTADLAASLEFNSYLAISPDDIITIFSPNPELGQNIKTSFPMIVAEELDADWSKVTVVQAALNAKKYERQLTGGSGAIPHSWERLRKAGATARYMLMQAAAKRWGVAPSTLRTLNGRVINADGSSGLSYGELATDAASIPVPTELKLKDVKDFKIIGTAVHNVDNREMFTGKPLFGMDFYRQGMLFATVQRPDSFGMKLKSVDAAAAKAMPGIVDVITFRNNVAVIGKSTWQILKARKLIKIEYEKEGNIESTSDHDRLLKELMESKEAVVRRKDGDVDTAFKNAAKIITREYQCPFLSHSPMEPMNFFAHVRADGVELIGPSQTPELARGEAAKLLGIAPELITLELTRLGGGFGRRLKTDYVLEAVEISNMLKAPVKVMWTREDDMSGGSYRPAVRYRFDAALDQNGRLIGYKLRGVGINPGGGGNSTREDNFPSGAVDNLLIDSVEHKSPITTGAWRAPITNFLAFAEQSFLDEVAAAANQDPVKFRLALLEKARNSPVGAIKYDIDRMKGVIELAAEKSGWGLKKNVSQGFSVYFSHRTYVAQVAEVEVVKGNPVLKKVHAVADCGIVVNQYGAKQQVRGGVVDGIGHAFFGAVTFKDGAAEQKNFNTYRLIRMKEVPEIDVTFVQNTIDPTGLGEPALPPTGGAVANAIFKATGKRLYNQPFVKQEEMKGVRLGERL
jgi:isoquinoline 1-oxidoreductase beta subunit